LETSKPDIRAGTCYTGDLPFDIGHCDKDQKLHLKVTEWDELSQTGSVKLASTGCQTDYWPRVPYKLKLDEDSSMELDSAGALKSGTLKYVSSDDGFDLHFTVPKAMTMDKEGTEKMHVSLRPAACSSGFAMKQVFNHFREGLNLRKSIKN